MSLFGSDYMQSGWSEIVRTVIEAKLRSATAHIDPKDLVRYAVAVANEVAKAEQRFYEEEEKE